MPFIACTRSSLSHMGKAIIIKNTHPLEYVPEKMSQDGFETQHCQKKWYTIASGVLSDIDHGIRFPDCLSSLYADTLNA